MRDAQEGQLDPLSVSIAADPDGGKLIEGAICIGYLGDGLFLEMRSDQIQRSKIQTEPLALPTVHPESRWIQSSGSA
jgi:hypothetical protein